MSAMDQFESYISDRIEIEEKRQQLSLGRVKKTGRYDSVAMNLQISMQDHCTFPSLCHCFETYLSHLIFLIVLAKSLFRLLPYHTI